MAYLYDEGDERERAAAAAHLARCPGCSEELAGLSETRHLLTAWTPPEVALGFRLPEHAAGAGSQSSSEPGGSGGRMAWWRQPLPAWAQLAAAAAIFAAGLGIGASTTPQRDAAAELGRQRELAAAVKALESLESRVRGIERTTASLDAAAAGHTTASAEAPDVMPRVTAQFATWEQRMRSHLATREELAQLVVQVKREEALSRQHLRDEFQSGLNEVSRVLLNWRNASE